MNVTYGFTLTMMFGLGSCKPLATGAQEHFAKEFSCPLNRVEVTKRSDLRISNYFPKLPTGEPPSEVAADPERLAKWIVDQASHSLGAIDENMDVYRVVGCDHEVIMGCAHPQSHDGVGADYSTATCITPPLGKLK